MNNKESKLSADLVLRSSSLILFAILIGLSIQFGIEKILEPDIEYGVFLNFLTFLITAVRFFHGNYIYHEKPRAEQPGRFMINFYFNIAELVVLCMVGRLIDEGVRFIYALLGLSIIDIAWAIFSVCSSKPKERYIFYIWGLLNFASAIFLTCLIKLQYSAVGKISIVILTFYILMAVLDYYLCRGYYFGSASKIP